MAGAKERAADVAEPDIATANRLQQALIEGILP
jgi:hypothetical protein